MAMFPFIWLHPKGSATKYSVLRTIYLIPGVTKTWWYLFRHDRSDVWSTSTIWKSGSDVLCRHPRCTMWRCAKMKDAISLTRIINLNGQHEHPTPYTRISEWRLVCVCSYHDKIIWVPYLPPVSSIFWIEQKRERERKTERTAKLTHSNQVTTTVVTEEIYIYTHDLQFQNTTVHYSAENLYHQNEANEADD